jgi:hypothetical protein
MTNLRTASQKQSPRAPSASQKAPQRDRSKSRDLELGPDNHHTDNYAPTKGAATTPSGIVPISASLLVQDNIGCLSCCLLKET